MTLDLSVVIPARNEHPAATFTLQAIWDQLEGSGLEWETILVDNLSNDKTGTFCKDRYWHAKGKHIIVRYDEHGSCWGARNAGCSIARGRILFLFDAHIVPSRDLFAQQLQLFKERPSATIVYTPVIWMGDSRCHTAYGYSLGENNGHMRSKFWGSWTKRRRQAEPYTIPMSGTAGIAIRREHYERIGGWPTPLSIYGGGEQWMSLATWMLGGECWIHPDTYVYHLADTRKYSTSEDEKKWSTNDAHFFNKCLVSYALGGEKWWEIVRDRCLVVWHKQYHEAAKRIALEGKAAGEPYRQWIEENAKYTLDEVLELEPWYSAVPV